MYLKQCWKYILYLLIAFVFIVIFHFVITPSTINNETSYFVFLGMKIYDLGAFATLIVGSLALIGVIYTVDKNYRAMKISSLQDKSANLLIDLEYSFIEHKDDEFILLTWILKYWKDHQKAFRLLTPHFYKDFLKILTLPNETNPSKIPEINANYIHMAIIAQITNVALDNEEPYFSFIKPELINDTKNIKELGEDENNYISRFKITKNNFKDYISKIEGEKTKKLISDKFNELDENIEDLLKNLKREIEDY